MEGGDLHTIHDQSALVVTQFLLTTGRGGEADEGDEVHHEACTNLPELVLGILVFSKYALRSGFLFLAEKNRGRDAGEDQAVEQSEGEGFVLAWNDGGKEGIHCCQTDNT